MLFNVANAEIAGTPLWLLLVGGIYITAQTTFVIWLLTGRATKPGEVAIWAESYRLRLTTGNVALVRWYVRLVITLRVVGGVAGVYLGFLTDRAFGLSSSVGAGWWTWVIGGWTVGALYAQRQVAAPTSGSGVASLTPRRLADYLPIGLRWAPLGATAFVAVGIGLTRIVYVVPVGPDAPSGFSLGAGVGTCLAIAGLVWLAQAHVIGQRQVPGAADVVAADEAIRTSTIHQVAGAGTAMICTTGISLWMSISTAGTTSAPMTSVFPWLLVFVALFSWRFFAYRSWQVRRTVGSAPTQSVGPSPA